MRIRGKYVLSSFIIALLNPYVISSRKRSVSDNQYKLSALIFDLSRFACIMCVVFWGLGTNAVAVNLRIDSLILLLSLDYIVIIMFQHLPSCSISHVSPIWNLIIFISINLFPILCHNCIIPLYIIILLCSFIFKVIQDNCIFDIKTRYINILDTVCIRYQNWRRVEKGIKLKEGIKRL